MHSTLWVCACLPAVRRSSTFGPKRAICANWAPTCARVASSRTWHAQMYMMRILRCGDRLRAGPAMPTLVRASVGVSVGVSVSVTEVPREVRCVAQGESAASNSDSSKPSTPQTSHPSLPTPPPTPPYLNLAPASCTLHPEPCTRCASPPCPTTGCAAATCAPYYMHNVYTSIAYTYTYAYVPSIAYTYTYACLHTV